MKRPYREGDWFAVPLGDGRVAAGIVTRGTRKAIAGAFFAQRGEEKALWSARFSDRALIERRWPLLGAQQRFDRAQFPSPPTDDVLEPGVVERALCARLDGRAFERERLVVRDLRSPIDARTLGAAPTEIRLQWREPLAVAELATLKASVARDISVRLYGRASAQLPLLAHWSVESLALDGEALDVALPPFPHVRALALDGMPRDLAGALAAFPSLRALRLRARGATIESATLTALPPLDALDLGDARIDDLAPVLGRPLAALRLRNIEGDRSLERLAGNPDLRVLSLAGLAHLESIGAVATLPCLESLEITGAWPLEIEAVAFVEHLPALRRLRLDLGGRRKNEELYRRRLLAEPLPFDEEIRRAGRAGSQEA